MWECNSSLMIFIGSEIPFPAGRNGRILSLTSDMRRDDVVPGDVGKQY